MDKLSSNGTTATNGGAAPGAVAAPPGRPQPGTSPFDRIMHVRPDGSAYWRARELMPYLGYVKWERMEDALDRARHACTNAGQRVADHFPAAGKMIDIGKGAVREVVDYELTRYGCYLTAMNCDPRKPEVAAAQSYFAAMTRAAELTRADAAPAASIESVLALCDGIRALCLRQATTETRLATTDASVATIQTDVATLRTTVADLAADRRIGIRLSDLPRSRRRLPPMNTRAKVNALVRAYYRFLRLKHPELGWEMRDIWNHLYEQMYLRCSYDAPLCASRRGCRTILDAVVAAGKLDDLHALASELFEA